jgi:cytochrome c553
MLRFGYLRASIMKTLLLVLGAATALALPLITGAVSNESQERSDALHSRPDLDHGAALFQSCAVCHGTSGGGTPDGHVPRIAGQYFSVLVKQLGDYRSDRRWDPLMEYMADRHLLKTAQDIADVAAYASEIAIVPEGGVSVGSGQYLARGSQIYTASCVSCHGKLGDGNGHRQIPRVAGQNYEYLVRQIHDAVEGRRPNFSVSHIRLLKRLDYADIMGVADFLARIPRRADQLMPQGMAAN